MAAPEHNVGKLDEAQSSAVSAPASARMLVLAGPGSGKTEVSARRIASLLEQGLGASSLLVLSFSRSAVRTLTKRLTRLDGLDDHVIEELRHVSIRTFDSWTFRILRRIGRSADDLLHSSYEDNIATLVETLRGPEAADVRTILKGVRHVIVDEFQDLAGVRGDLVFELLKCVAPPGSSSPLVGFTLLGDPAQSIYGFGVRSATRECLHGSTTNELLNAIRKQYPHELQDIQLGRNHRSEPGVASTLEKLRQVLRGNASGETKLAEVASALTKLPGAEFSLDGGLFDSSKSQSIAILARTNGEVLRIAQRIFGSEVAGPGIAFHVGNGDSHFAPAWIAGLLACIRSTTLTQQQFVLIHGKAEKEDPTTFQALEVPGVDLAWARLLAAAGAPANANSIVVRELAKRLCWPDAFPDDGGHADAGLFLSTIHQAKGKEFDLVAILERNPEREHAEADPEEEAYVGFVALSRGVKRVVKLPADSIHPPPSARDFGHGTRKRLVFRRREWVNMEFGLQGDVLADSFADVGVLGSEAAVLENYRFLAANSSSLMGHKVMLKKGAVPGSNGSRARYEICLQDERQPGRVLGAMSQNVVYDLLGLLHPRNSLPKIIMNLRILRVISIAEGRETSATVASAFASSGMWLGVQLFGTGDFKTFN